MTKPTIITRVTTALNRRPLVKLGVYIALGALALVVVWYMVAGVTDWYDTRGALGEAAAQKKIAEDEKAKAAQAQAEAQKWFDEYNKQKGIAEEKENYAKQLEHERDALTTELDQRRAATASARRSYDAVRSGNAPRRAPLASSDDERRRRLGELCTIYPDDPACK